MEHCGKHDIVFTEGGTCWCCEESKLTPEQKTAKYLKWKPPGYVPPTIDFSRLSDDDLARLSAALEARKVTAAEPVHVPSPIDPVVPPAV